MGSEKDSAGPFGGWFGTLGLIVGFVYGAGIGDGNWVVAVGGAIFGGWLGIVIEHIVARLILIALFIFMIIARQAFFDAIFDSAYWVEPVNTAEAVVLLEPPASRQEFQTTTSLRILEGRS